MKVSEKNFLNIQGFMRTELNLKGNELLVYAIIYGFSQDGDNYFTGSAQYIADWCGISKRAALAILKKLTEEGFLEKKEVVENSVKFCHYRGRKFTGVVKKVHRGGEETSPGGGEETSPYNNILDNKEYKKEYKKERATAPRFTRPSLEEVRSYCEERGNGVDPEHFIDYYEANGWKVGKNPMKDWKAAVRNWEKRENPAPKRKEKDVSGEWWANL